MSPIQQASAFQGHRKVGRSIGDTMPKIQQKLIHKGNVAGKQDNVKIVGKNGKWAASSNTTKNADGSQNILETTTPNIPMSFGTENWTTISTQIGATALLPCTVHALGEGVVSYKYTQDKYMEIKGGVILLRRIYNNACQQYITGSMRAKWFSIHCTR